MVWIPAPVRWAAAVRVAGRDGRRVAAGHWQAVACAGCRAGGQVPVDRSVPVRRGEPAVYERGSLQLSQGPGGDQIRAGHRQLPPPPAPVASVAGHLYYYSYRLGGVWQSWEPARLLARWHRVIRGLADDGSCRPVWLAMKTAAAGQIEVLAPAPPASAEFGVRVVIHATSRGPRQPAVVSETVVDGIIAAFHVGLGHGPAAAAVAAAMAPRLPGMAKTDIEALAAGSTPGPLFSPSAFTVKGTHIQISPCDERCQAGEVTIRPDAEGQYPQISGEIFLLRRVSA
jgi:hypothetical protein